LPTNQNVLLSDTVGFIRKLPHDLVESFKATLEEVVEADLLLHVVDISHPQADEQIAAVNAVLSELGAQDKPTLDGFHKTIASSERQFLRYRERFPHAVAISAKLGDGVPELLGEISSALRPIRSSSNCASHMTNPRSWRVFTKWRRSLNAITRARARDSRRASRHISGASSSVH